MDVGGWWADLGGTLIGTGVGFALAMVWDRKRDRDQEARDRESSMRSILLNLEDIAERLQLPTFEDANDPERPGWYKIVLDKAYLARAPFDAAVSSGRLALFPPDMQDRLSTTYELIRQVQLHLDLMNTTYSRVGDPAENSAIIGTALQHYSVDAPIAKDMIQRAVAELQQFLGIPPRPAWIAPPPGTLEPLDDGFEAGQA